MRFKATFTDHGLRRLEKGFLPTLEKCGKVVDILLSAEEVNFIQTGLHTDSSLSACARFNTNALFKTEDFKLSSMHENVVAFSTDLGLLLRALRSSSTNSADTVSIKLIKKLPPGCTDTDPKFKKPCLSISAMSSAMSLVQELFVGTPYKADRINELVETKDMGVMCPYYIDIHPWIDKLQAMADKMKTVCDTVKVSTCKNGDFYADVSDFNVQLGVQLCACQIYPQETVAAVEADRSLSVTNQLAAASESGDAISVDLPIKHLIRVLNVSSISSPNLILCGIPPGRELMHVMFAYHEAGSVDRYDDTMAMSIKIPSCLPG